MSGVQARCINHNAYEANLRRLAYLFGVPFGGGLTDPASRLFVRTKSLYHTFLRKVENNSKFLNIEWRSESELTRHLIHTRDEFFQLNYPTFSLCHLVYFGLGQIAALWLVSEG